MKWVIIVICFCTTRYVEAQEIDSAVIFENTHGLENEEASFYGIEGYSIFVHVDKASVDEKGIKKIKKTYDINKKVSPQKDSLLEIEHKYLTTVEPVTKKFSQIRTFFLIPKEKDRTLVIGFYAPNRDEALERFFVRSIVNGSIPRSVFSSMEVDSIRFAGRFIRLGPACHWEGTENIQCPDRGQMNWAEFRDSIRARQMLDIQFDVTENRFLGKVIDKQEVNILFEGIETTATKVRYKIKVPKIIMGGSNELIIYYVLQKVRGRYVACVLSHYTDDINAKTLPPLLSEVMKLRN